MKRLRVQQEGLDAGKQRELCLDRRLATLLCFCRNAKHASQKVSATWSRFGHSFQAVGRLGFGLKMEDITVLSMIQPSLPTWCSIHRSGLHHQCCITKELSRKTVHVRHSSDLLWKRCLGLVHSLHRLRTSVSLSRTSKGNPTSQHQAQALLDAHPRHLCTSNTEGIEQ